MTQAVDLQSLLLAVGRLEGRVGEAVHATNNTAQKVDALAEKVASNTNLPARVDDHEARIGALETDKDRRDGAMGFGGWLIKSPLVGWLATAAIALWAVLKGKTG